MPIDRDSASTHLRKLSQLPFFNAVKSEAFSGWVTVVSDGCDDIPHAIRAVALLLQARVLPTAPEVISDAIEATRERAASHYHGGCCGQLAEGKTYMSHDPSTDATAEEQKLQASPPLYLLPSKCVNGWVHWTEWRASGYVDYNGDPIQQPYEFSGRCKCQPGGWA